MSYSLVSTIIKGAFALHSAGLEIYCIEAGDEAYEEICKEVGDKIVREDFARMYLGSQLTLETYFGTFGVYKNSEMETDTYSFICE